MCVWLKFEHGFSTCLSPARNTFVSSTKNVHLQITKNPFVASDIHACLYVISCLEESSRGYLIDSSKRIRMQCDTVLGGV